METTQAREVDFVQLVIGNKIYSFWFMGPWVLFAHYALPFEEIRVPLFIAGYQGDYLFGDFSIADCMYAPMAMRFHTYGVKLSSLSRQYLEVMLKNPAVNRCWREAECETENLPEFEFGDEIRDLFPGPRENHSKRARSASKS